MNRILFPAQSLQGHIQVPGDKSMSHRALLLGALAQGKTHIHNLLFCEDVRSTWKCLEQLGVTIEQKGENVIVHGVGPHGLQAPKEPLDCGNSGTTMRLLMGILVGQPFSSVLIGDSSLQTRPMKRVTEPLIQMGANIQLSSEGTAPIHIKGTTALHSMVYSLPIASAQVKSALLFAGLFAKGTTQLTGNIQSRDHTERMMPQFGVSLYEESHINPEEKSSISRLSIPGEQTLHATDLTIPGDFSSAAFWLVAATLVPKSKIFLSQVSLNPTRTGLLSVLKRMGAYIEEEPTFPLIPQANRFEPMGNLVVHSADVQSTNITKDEIPFLIDELPIFAILATQAKGRTQVSQAQELRTKETDRIAVLAQNLSAMGVHIHTYSDGFSLEGPQTLQGAIIDPHHDHRMAMAFSIAALCAQCETVIKTAECSSISYPTFYEHLRSIYIPKVR